MPVWGKRYIGEGRLCRTLFGLVTLTYLTQVAVQLWSQREEDNAVTMEVEECLH